MITGDLDLERTVWDAEYRRRVIAFLADQAEEKASGRTATVIPFPVPETSAGQPPRRAAKR